MAEALRVSPNLRGTDRPLLGGRAIVHLCMDVVGSCGLVLVNIHAEGTVDLSFNSVYDLILGIIAGAI